MSDAQYEEERQESPAETPFQRWGRHFLTLIGIAALYYYALDVLPQWPAIRANPPLHTIVTAVTGIAAILCLIPSMIYACGVLALTPAAFAWCYERFTSWPKGSTNTGSDLE